MKIKNVNLGNEISRILTEKRISKAQFADSIGVKRQNVNLHLCVGLVRF